jgi:hypothetical protein
LPSQKNIPRDSLDNLIELQEPGDQPHEPSKVYIDSVRKLKVDKQLVLVIRGSFPDGCSYLESVDHNIDNGDLYLELDAWRDAEKMCTQALSPFTYIYDKITEDELSEYSSVIINDSVYEF